MMKGNIIYNYKLCKVGMKKIIKTFILMCVIAIMMCSYAFAAESGVVLAGVLNIRSGPSTSDTIVGKLYAGTTISILSTSDNWHQIQYKTETAYVSADYVKIVDQASRSAFRTEETDQTEPTVSAGEQIVEFAMNYIGVPYVYGGSTPQGFDCSGFTQYVMKNFDIFLPRSSHDQYSMGTRVAKAQLIPGDLVFFKYSSGYRINHVGIYIGDGNFIHSPIPGQTVKIDSLTNGYFNTYYYGATRVIN